jgi:hypothetical protein
VQAHFSRISLAGDLALDQKLVLNDAIRLIQVRSNNLSYIQYRFDLLLIFGALGSEIASANGVYARTHARTHASVITDGTAGGRGGGE